MSVAMKSLFPFTPRHHTHMQAAMAAGNFTEALSIYSTGKNSFSGLARRTFFVSDRLRPSLMGDHAFTYRLPMQPFQPWVAGALAWFGTLSYPCLWALASRLPARHPRALPPPQRFASYITANGSVEPLHDSILAGKDTSSLDAAIR